MARLDRNWLTNGLIDFEYKKYIILSYIQQVQAEFTDRKLYPYFPDLKGHYHQLKEFLGYKKTLEGKFPKIAESVDLNSNKIHFRELTKENVLLENLNEIALFAKGELERQVNYGHELLEFIIDKISIEPVGISPLNKNEGFLLLLFDNKRDVCVYQYRVSLVKRVVAEEVINTTYIRREQISLANTFEQIKRKLLKRNNDLPNPATFSVISKINIPHEETFLPITKKMLAAGIAA